MPDTVKNIKIDGKDYIQTTTEKGAVITVPKPGPVVPKPDPEYKTILKTTDTAKLKVGTMTQDDRDKLLAAIALKLGIL